MSLELFLTALLVVSIFTGLFTQGLKILLDEAGWKYKANLLAGAVAIVLAVFVGIAYQILAEAAITDKMMVYLIALVLLSWLSAMVGYDKVVQAISQIRGEGSRVW